MNMWTLKNQKSEGKQKEAMFYMSKKSHYFFRLIFKCSMSVNIGNWS